MLRKFIFLMLTLTISVPQASCMERKRKSPEVSKKESTKSKIQSSQKHRKAEESLYANSIDDRFHQFGAFGIFPEEVILKIIKQYIKSLLKNKVKSIYDLDKWMKATRLARTNKMFRAFCLDSSVRLAMLKKVTSANSQQAINDLAQAAFKADFDIVQDLIAVGIDVTQMGSFSYSYNFILNLEALEKIFPKEIAQKYLDIDTFKSIEFKGTPLEMVLQHDSNNTNPDGQDHPSVKIVEALLKAGANPNFQSNPELDDALTNIINNCHIDDESKNKIVLMLLHSGANPFSNKQFDSLVEQAPSAIQTSLLNYSYDKVLWDCAKTDNATVIMSLMSYKNKGTFPNFNIDAQDEKGYTALMIAAKNNHFPCVWYLLLNGANPNIKANNGRTALSIAQDNDNCEMIKLLQKKFKINQNVKV